MVNLKKSSVISFMRNEAAHTNWAKDLSGGLISTNQLIEHGLMEKDYSCALDEVKNNLNIRVPKQFLNDIKNNNESLKKQFIPSTDELVFFPQEMADPIGDEIYTPVEGITHRYPDRLLLKPTYMCAGYCRFCFRRYKVSHSEFNLKEEAYQKALTYISQAHEVREVILTGGDPLTLTDSTLAKILNDLAMVPQVKIIRFHTRVPSLLPSRVTPELLKILKNTGKTTWIVVHMNHADEFQENTKQALAAFIDNGFPVLMQSVLLKDVNTTRQDLINLFKTAVENRVKPYYLHYPDLAQGTNHFRIPLSDAVTLVKSLRGKISGLCLPQFVVDLPGGKGKVEVNPHHAQELAAGLWQFESPLDGSLVQVQYPL